MGKKKPDMLTVGAADDTFTLQELSDLVAKAYALGVPGTTRLRFDTSIQGVFDFTVPGVLLERAYIPVGPFESVTDEDKGAEESP
jgi:hypothetical protein